MDAMSPHETLDRQNSSVSSMERTDNSSSSTGSETMIPVQQPEGDNNNIIMASTTGIVTHNKDFAVSNQETGSRTSQEKETEATTTAPSTVDTTTDFRKMKLIVRSQYWGT